MKITRDELQPMLDYIKQSWTGALFRSNLHLADAAVDPKTTPGDNGRWNVFIPKSENAGRVMDVLRKQMSEANLGRINLCNLPEDGEVQDHGLLYLPKSYVVPGGRFNEMYGWDSYFIIAGLLLDGEIELAKNMVDNFIYQVIYYGKILNANRTYYLSRSNPPFLSRMVLEVYEKTEDKEWLASTLSALEDTYKFWMEEPHITPETGLSRYYDTGNGPAPEVISSERDEKGFTHYDRILDYFLTHDHDRYDVSLYYDKENHQLTDLFYKGDRTMRESGFDPSDRFGPFNIDCMSYNPVCLNSLLYQFENDMMHILKILGLSGIDVWRTRALTRAAKIQTVLWDEQDGQFYDYHSTQKKLRKYLFTTTFYPMWVGVATKEQAARLVKSLPLFERDGGLLCSNNESGMQWDMPFGWAPLNMVAIEGLRKYGYNEEADRLSEKFISMCLKNFTLYGTLVEKYDVISSSSQLHGIDYGYSTNEIGFGWTNGTILRLLSALQKKN
ncbi:MAG: trehalase family glycosidase [Patescibacteria group bacterium]